METGNNIVLNNVPEDAAPKDQKRFKEIAEKIRTLLSKCFVYEDSKKTVRMLIIRMVVFLAIFALFFLNTKFYIKITKSKTTLDWVRILKLFLFATVCTVLPLVKLKLPKRAVYSVQMGSIVLGFLMSFWAGEHIINNTWHDIKLVAIVFNLMIMFALFTLFYIITNRQKGAIIGVYCFTILFATINYYVNKFRGDPIQAADIYTTGTALNVLGNYTIAPIWRMMETLFAGAGLFCLLIFLPAEEKRVKGWKRIFYIIPGGMLVLLTFYTFAVAAYPLDQGIKVKTFNPLKSYKTNGELLNFFRGFYYMQVFEPEGYSKNSVRELMDNSGYTSDPVDLDDGQKNPNIIFVMNESLMDFTWFDNVILSEDPLEYIHSLKKSDNAIVGKMDVSVFGGRTAITEYEVITGNSAAFFPDSAVPYALYVKDIEPSITWNMKDLGYCGNMAYHPYKAKGYSRPKAYPNLGFTEFISLETIKENLQESDYLRSFVSDSADTRDIIRLYEEQRANTDAPFYIFNVTMQNHGGYESDFDNFEQDIHVYGDLAGDLQFKRYINLVDYSDDAFKELTDYFSKVDEPTIIVTWGDHLPNLSTEMYNTLYGKSKSSFTTAEKFSYYETPFVIWANYDINKDGRYNERFKNVSANYLSSMVMDIAGVPMTAYQKYLVDMQKEIPIFTSHGYIDKDQVFYELDNLESPYYNDWVLKYQTFEYNYEFDPKNRISSFYMLKTDNSSMEAAIKAKE
ncbi:MAG: sulfatase-like hydrolase/transferase [Lachnospiraceae bacterium]|nr:sulfatase-like hydrolase/transferase [Lachnospiraceae bacterium]